MILFCGGEDIDFPNGAAVSVTGAFRSGYARCGIFGATNVSFPGMMKSTVFSGGALTSAWITAEVFINVSDGGGYGLVGFGLSGTSKGLFIGRVSGSSTKTALFTYDGSTWTLLASESGTSLAANAMYRFDMQVTSYGASATVNVYLNQSSTPLITYTGDVTVSGMTDFDSVFSWGLGSFNFSLSEIMVADGDTRGMPGLVTLALTGAGATDAWTSGTYSNINGTTFSDANPAYTNTTAQDEQFTLNGLPSGTWTVGLVKTTLRAAASAGATATKVNLGYGDGSTQAFGGAAQTASSGAFGTLEQYDTLSPITGTTWAQSDFSSLQMDLRSA